MDDWPAARTFATGSAVDRAVLRRLVATFDDELVAVGGLSILWFDRSAATSMWDAHDLHHMLRVPIDHRQMLAGRRRLDWGG